MLKKISCAILLFYLLVLVLSGCAPGRKAVQIKGSDTMVNLAQAWAEEFMNRHPELPIAVTGGGSGTGIAALIGGSTDIAQSSRTMGKKEIAMALKRGVKVKEYHVANDGIAVVVNPSNPVKKLTVKQLSDIFTGKIKRWNEVGGDNNEIVALSRDRNSGTHVFFLEQIVKLGDKKNGNEFAAGVLMMPSSQAIVEEVSGNPSAVGYIGLGYLTQKEKALAIARDERSPFVTPSVKSVTDKTYPLSRSLLLYTNGAPKEKVRSFINFVLSPEGQKIVLKMDFVAVK
jgi:phosphate transport system substrate-binding protein